MSEQNKETEIPQKKSWLKKMGWAASLFSLKSDSLACDIWQWE